MALFQSLLVLLFVASFLMAASRPLRVPYPTLLALAGAAASLLPFAPEVAIDPQLALAIFIAPALLDAAYDTAPADLRRLWFPLAVLAVGAVVTTTAAVALAGHWLVGLPIAAAIALGAIVSPPDAVAANAVLSQLGFSRHSALLLRGESLLNDATALLLFNGAIAFAAVGPNHGLLEIVAEVPGGIALGLVLAWISARIMPLFAGMLASVVMQFTMTFGVWLIADRLGVSPVLAIITYAMAAARSYRRRAVPPRERVRSYAVWAVLVFGLNVLAFLLMGLQLRPLVTKLHGDTVSTLTFAVQVFAIVVAVRFLVLLLYRGTTGWMWRTRRPQAMLEPVPWRITALMGWCGMRGLLTLATAYALPANFPARDLIQLTAMIVVLGTLVLQGLTLRPLMHLFGLVGSDDSLRLELADSRRLMLEAGIAAADREPDHSARGLRRKLAAAIEVSGGEDPQGRTEHDEVVGRVVAAQRDALNDLRATGRIADDVFYLLEEELDWSELATRPSGAIGDAEA